MNVNSVWAHRDWAFLGRCFTVVVEKESRTYLCVCECVNVCECVRVRGCEGVRVRGCSVLVVKARSNCHVVSCHVFRCECIMAQCEEV